MRAAPLLLCLVACGDDTTHHLADAAPGDAVTQRDGSAQAQVNPGIYVTDGSGAVFFFAPDATGNAAPIRTIAGPTTGLATPIGIAVDHAGDVYVANRTGGAVTVYGPDATGDAAPLRTLTATGMGSPETVALDADDNLFVAACPGCGESNGGDIGVFHFPKDATASDYSIEGSATGFTNPQITLDDAGELVVANSFGGLVETFPADATGDVAPLRSFTPTGDQNLQSLVASHGIIALASPTDGVDLFAADTTGTASPAGTIAPSTTLPLQYPGGMHLDASSAQPVLYLVDFNGNAIYVIQTTGSGTALAVATVTTISGSATGLAGPLDIDVVR